MIDPGIPPTSRRRHHRPFLRGAGIGSLLLISLTLIISGGALGSGGAPALAHSSVKHFLPPYTKLIPYVGSSRSVSFCNATAGFPSPPHAIARTGNVSVTAFTQATACPNQYSVAFLTAYLAFEGLGFTATTSGLLDVSFLWNISWAGSLTANVPVNTSIYDSQAIAQFYEDDFVYDVTTGNLVAGDFSNIWATTAWNTTIVAGQHGALTNGTVPFDAVAGNTYDLEPTLSIFLNAYADPGCAGHATFNLALGGHGARLTEIVIY